MYVGAQIAGVSGRQYYYGSFRFHYRHRWEERLLNESIEKMKGVEDEDRITVRQKLASEVGFTGVSILHRLNRLYQFNVLKDLIFDTMHTLVLRIINRHLQYYSEIGFLKDPVLERRLQKMPWTAGMYACMDRVINMYHIMDPCIFSELKDGRIPDRFSRMGFWKAEEFRKFTFPASECVFGGHLPDEVYNVWVLIVRITEMVFCCGRNGISGGMLKLLDKLIWRHNILSEEIEGEKMCVISLHNLVHLPDDIKRFSSSDNFWCCKKNLEKTCQC